MPSLPSHDAPERKPTALLQYPLATLVLACERPTRLVVPTSSQPPPEPRGSAPPLLPRSSGATAGSVALMVSTSPRQERRSLVG